MASQASITVQTTSGAEYTVHKIVNEEELRGFAQACWAAWSTPYVPSMRIAAPISGYLEEDHERGRVALLERILADFKNSTSPEAAGGSQRVWLYAKHTSSNEIVGGVVLNFAEGSAFPNGCPSLQLHWWPENTEVRAFAEEMMNQVYTPRSMWMQRPFGGMWNLCVHPSHRGRGIGQLLLAYNNMELDARGLEGFVEATELGRPTYAKAGFQVVMKVATFIPAGRGTNWAKWYHEMAPAPFYAMWRPKNGVVNAGERTKPWQQGPSIPI